MQGSVKQAVAYVKCRPGQTNLYAEPLEACKEGPCKPVPQITAKVKKEAQGSVAGKWAGTTPSFGAKGFFPTRPLSDFIRGHGLPSTCLHVFGLFILF